MARKIKGVIFKNGKWRVRCYLGGREHSVVCVLEKARIRQLDMHAARHTYASRLIANGENLKCISEQLGHGGIAITCAPMGT